MFEQGIKQTQASLSQCSPVWKTGTMFGIGSKSALAIGVSM